MWPLRLIARRFAERSSGLTRDSRWRFVFSEQTQRTAGASGRGGGGNRVAARVKLPKTLVLGVCVHGVRLFTESLALMERYSFQQLFQWGCLVDDQSCFFFEVRVVAAGCRSLTGRGAIFGVFGGAVCLCTTHALLLAGSVGRASVAQAALHVRDTARRSVMPSRAAPCEWCRNALHAPPHCARCFHIDVGRSHGQTDVVCRRGQAG